MEEKNIIGLKEKQQQAANINFIDITLILSFIIGVLLTTILFLKKFYIDCSLIQTICIYLINAPTFAYIIFKICIFVLVKSKKNAIKRGGINANNSRLHKRVTDAQGVEKSGRNRTNF